MAKTTPNCISLGQGAPFYHPDPKYLQALPFSDAKYHQYTPDPGIPKLRQALADKLHTDNGIKSLPNEIIVTPGANQAFFNVLLTISDPGDEIILLSPYYFNHHMACTQLNLNAVVVPLNSDLSLSFNRIRQAISARTRAIVFVNPGNPTGKVHTAQEISLLHDIIDDYDLILIADETYEYFTYGNSVHISAAANTHSSEEVVSIGSFSKTYGIPGWRLGYYHANNKIIGASLKVQDTIGICAPAPSQYLGLTLLKHRAEIIPEFVGMMQKNYELAQDLLEEVRWLSGSPSTGAYYLFPKQSTSIRTANLVKKLITEDGVYVIPGGAFGDSWEEHIRISFANVDVEMLKTAFSRLKQASF